MRIASHDRFFNENKSMSQEVRQLQMFQHSTIARIRNLEDVIQVVQGVAEQNKWHYEQDNQDVPDGADSDGIASQPFQRNPTGDKSPGIHAPVSPDSGRFQPSDDPVTLDGNNRLAALVRSLSEKGVLSVNDNDLNEGTSHEFKAVISTVGGTVKSTLAE